MNNALNQNGFVHNKRYDILTNGCLSRPVTGNTMINLPAWAGVAILGFDQDDFLSDGVHSAEQ